MMHGQKNIKLQISNFMKIHPVGAELYHEDRRTDRETDRSDETNRLFFCNFAILRKHLQMSSGDTSHRKC